MPNKKINQLDSRVISSSDLLLVGDPVTGTSYKSLVTGLGLVYVPYTGATANVDLGEYELKAGQFELDQTPTGTAGVAVTRWNDSVGTIETTLKGGNVILRHGRDMFERVVNKTGIQLTKAAYQAVRISTAQGQRLGVALAQANNDNNSADTIGLAVETIDNNQEGYIYTVGEIQDIDTTGALQGETWVDGDVLYLSPTTAGRITNVKPVAPQHLVVIGYVVYAHQNHGKIYVKTMNGWELGELHDVDTTGATNGQVLKYNGTIWTPSSDLDTGITSLNGLTALTQTFATGTSGTDFNISSATSTHTFNLPTASALNRGLVSSSDWSTFNSKIGGTIASGQVAYGSGAGTIAGSNNLFWDSANGRLGIGTNTPTKTLYTKGQTVIDGGFGVQDNTTISGGVFHVRGTSAAGAQNGGITIGTSDTNTGIYRLRLNGNSSSGAGEIGVPYGYALTLQGGGTYFGNAAENGPVVIGSKLLVGTSTDSGQRLQVNGDAFIKGSGNTSGSTALTVQNSDGTNLMRMLNNGQFSFGSSASSVLIYPSTTSDNLSVGGDALTFNIRGNVNSASTGGINFSGDTSAITSGTHNVVAVFKPFAPSSGTAQFRYLTISPVINQTGGANGITRGLYINPTLTAAADWRSIEWSNNSGWGLYGAGTAPNFLNGNLGIGNTGVTNVNLRIDKNIEGSTTSYGVLLGGSIRSGVTSQAIGFVSNPSIQNTAFTLTQLRHFYAHGISSSGSATITNQSGFYAESLLTGATNNYGFYGDIPSGTGRWNLYMNGTANNYMAGRLGIGSTGLTNTTLRIGSNITGATSHFSVFAFQQVQSDVTSSATFFATEAATQATAFTLPLLRHYAAVQGTIGAGSTVTTQAGFTAHETLIGATNNYGFYGNIASGTGRWNFFAIGTAANYLNGNTIIGGSAVDGGQKLQVNGTTQMTPAADSSALTSTGYSVTGSGTTRMIDLSGTWNTTGNVNGIFMNITNTASGASSNLIDLQSSGVSRFRVTPAGIIGVTSTSEFVGFRLTFSGGLATTSGTQNSFSSLMSISPTSGTMVYNNINLAPTINQTGGANGITRGIYINPTLTSAADWRAIEAVSASNANHTLLKLRNATVDVLTVKADSKIGFYNATPVAQATTGIAEAAFVENSGGTAINVDSTFAGYTIQQIAQALKDLGILA